MATLAGPSPARVDPTLETTQRLVMRYGWNATSYQIVNPKIRHWFSQDGEAVIGYVRKHRVRVVAGAPICAEEKLEQVIAEWEIDCKNAGDKVCYFGAAGRVETFLQSKDGYSTVVLGAQPVWTPQEWIERTKNDSSLRAQLNRAKNKGVSIEEWTASKATNNPDLQRCLQEWLTTRGLPPLHFLVEPETLASLGDRRIFVALRNGKAVGFTVLAPVPKRNGYLTEQFPRGKNAPNGTVELLIDAAVRAAGQTGAEYITMGLVPLSTHGHQTPNTPTWLKLILKWVRAHGRRFYNFDGLEWFKTKFHPEEWEPIYAISKEERFSPRTLYAIAAAFSDGSPIVAIVKGLGRAVTQEARWLLKR
jgi:phosphatidylglycerol lysyltransferase